MKIAFFGTPRFAQIVLEDLIGSSYKPDLVITSPDAKFGRGQQLESSPVKQTSVKNHITVLEPRTLLGPAFLTATGTTQFDLAILVAYGKIIPKEIFALPDFGFLNVHPSLLPKYRGPSPIQSAILTGEKKTGVTIMKLDSKIDHGPIITQKESTIEDSDTHQTLIEKLGSVGSKLLLETLPDYLSGKLKPQSQNHSRATTTFHIKKQDGYFDIESPPDPQTFGRMVRAYYPWPTVWTRLQTTDYKLLTIKFLPGNLIQPEGKKPMTVKEFLNGYPQTRESLEKIIKP